MWCINHIQLPCVNAPRPVTGGPKILREIPGFAYAHVMILTTRRGVEIHKMCVLSFPWSVNLVSLWHWANPKTTVFFFANRAPSKLREDQALIRLYLAVQRCCRRKTPRSRSTNSQKKSIKKPKKKHEPKMIGNGFWICFSPEKPGFPSLFSRDVAASIAPTLNEIDCLACHVRWARLKYPGWKMDIYLPGCSWTHGISEWVSTQISIDSHIFSQKMHKKKRDIYKPTFFAAATKPFFMTFHEKLVNRDLIVMPHYILKNR